MAFRLGFRAALPNSRPPKQAARPRLWATQAAVESLVIQRTSLFMVDGLGSLEGTSLNEVATHVEEFPLHVFAGPGCARQLIRQRRSRGAQERCRRGYRHGRAARGKNSLYTRPQGTLRNWSNSLAIEEDLGATPS